MFTCVSVYTYTVLGGLTCNNTGTEQTVWFSMFLHMYCFPPSVFFVVWNKSYSTTLPNAVFLVTLQPKIYF